MSCWGVVQFITKRKNQNVLSVHIKKEDSNMQDSNMHQLVESNVAALEDNRAHVRERVSSWLESSIDCGGGQKKKSVTHRIFRRVTFSSQETCERLLCSSWLRRSESDSSGFSDFS
jgi:hypothetical protein